MFRAILKITVGAVALFAAASSAESAKRVAKKRLYHPDAYDACSELAEYVGSKQQQEWERCLAKETRRVIRASPGASRELIAPYR